MKNISRRVFIKGLAVAGVAAAASTVLAGCNTNMIPGVDDGADDQPETPDASNSLTLTDKYNTSKTFSMEFAAIETGSAAFGNEKVGVIRVNLSNDLGKAVYLAPTTGTTGVLRESTGNSLVATGDYLIFVDAYENNLAGNKVTLYSSKACGSAFGDHSAKTGATTTDLFVKDVTDIQNSLSVKVTLKKILNFNASNADKRAFEELDSKTVTLNV